MPPRRYAESRTRSGLCRVGRELRLKPHILFSNLGKVGNRDSINAKAFEVERGPFFKFLLPLPNLNQSSI